MTAKAPPFAALRQLWIESFGDSAQIPDAFFSTAFSPNRYMAIFVGNTPVSALYWLPCTCNGSRFAYIYAAATRKDHRGHGYFRQLLDQVHEKLQKDGYEGVILVPGCPALVSLYEKFGYRVCTAISEISCEPDSMPVFIQAITKQRYAERRRDFLPEDGIVQEGETLDFLETMATFYEGADFLLVAAIENGQLIGQELLGNPTAAPGILRALNCRNGTFLTPGNSRPFAMYLPLTENCPTPSYFGLALD